MTPNMSKQVMRKVLQIQKIASKSSDPTQKKRLTKQDTAKLEKMALEVVEAFAGKLDSKKMPKNPIDRAIARAVLQNKNKVVNLIEHRAAEGAQPSYLDYYAIYYEIMRDSGLLSIGLLDTDTLTCLDRWRIAEGATSSCSACSWCASCASCGACLACGTGIGVIATGAAAFTMSLGAATAALV